MRKLLLFTLIMGVLAISQASHRVIRMERLTADAGKGTLRIVISESASSGVEFLSIIEHPELVFDLKNDLFIYRGEKYPLPYNIAQELGEAMALIQYWALMTHRQMEGPDEIAALLK